MARIRQIISRRDFSFLLPLILSLLPLQSAAQEGAVRRRVEIIHSDEMQYGRLGDRSRNKLNGNVSLKHNDLTMTCDSALYYDDTNEVYAYSNIHIRQGDTIHIWGNYLFYDGDTGKAVMTDSVKLADKETQLFTRKIDYDTNTQIAVYDAGGRILNGEKHPYQHHRHLLCRQEDASFP